MSVTPRRNIVTHTPKHFAICCRSQTYSTLQMKSGHAWHRMVRDRSKNDRTAAGVEAEVDLEGVDVVTVTITEVEGGAGGAGVVEGGGDDLIATRSASRWETVFMAEYSK